LDYIGICFVIIIKNNYKDMNNKLYKVGKKERKFLGVCGGISKYLNNDLDPVMIRLIWFFSCFFSPFMILLYFILAFVLTTEKS
jgi:phage shock protein PspC (stress-responsive transcriptional regulator)